MLFPIDTQVCVEVDSVNSPGNNPNPILESPNLLLRESEAIPIPSNERFPETNITRNSIPNTTIHTIDIKYELIDNDDFKINYMKIQDPKNSSSINEGQKESICNAELENHKNYKCNTDSCGKSFSQIRSLNRHIHTVHEGHKDYKCKSCGKCFSLAHNLKSHILKIHKNQK